MDSCDELPRVSSHMNVSGHHSPPDSGCCDPPAVTAGSRAVPTQKNAYFGRERFSAVAREQQENCMDRIGCWIPAGGPRNETPQSPVATSVGAACEPPDCPCAHVCPSWALLRGKRAAGKNRPWARGWGHGKSAAAALPSPGRSRSCAGASPGRSRPLQARKGRSWN